jgi:cytoskeletal protein CcmA (bactofilin family)
VTATGLAAFGTLGRAEQTMVDGVGNGVFDRVGAGGLPAEGETDRQVRAELVRALLLGGEGMPRMHEKGLRLSGAWVTGTLDLEGCRIPRDIGLLDCRFDAVPVLRSAVIDTLSLDGSVLPGLNADRLEARGDLLFRSARVNGPIALKGARIEGDLVFDGANLTNPGEVCLAAERISIRGGALFRGAELDGELVLSGGRIGGHLDLVGATIARPGSFAVEANSVSVAGDVALRHATVTGSFDLQTARVGGDLDLSGAALSAPGGMALNLDRTTVAAAFFLRQGARIDGTLSLAGAELGAILDEPASWPATGDLVLNRCLYGALLGAATESEPRLEWLARQTPARWGEDFWPQPYEQLAKVLLEMGHDDDARSVLMAKERLSRRARRARTQNPLRRALLLLNDSFLGLTTGYGRMPLLALVWMFVLWALGTMLYSHLQTVGALRPYSAVILRSPEWVLCSAPQSERLFLVSLGVERDGLARPGQTQMACYLEQPEADAFPKFNAPMYSAEAVILGLGVGQKDIWSPDTRTPIGYFGKWFAYFQTIAGLALGLLAVAGFSGIVKSR